MSRLGLDTPKSRVSSRSRYSKVSSRLGLKAPCLDFTSSINKLSQNCDFTAVRAQEYKDDLKIEIAKRILAKIRHPNCCALSKKTTV